MKTETVNQNLFRATSRDCACACNPASEPTKLTEIPAALNYLIHATEGLEKQVAALSERLKSVSASLQDAPPSAPAPDAPEGICPLANGIRQLAQIVIHHTRQLAHIDEHLQL